MREPKLSNKALAKTRILSPTVLMAPLALLFSSGCVDEDKPKDDMAMGKSDLAMRPPDLALPKVDMATTTPDLAGTNPDLATGDKDMAGGSPDLSMPPRDMASGPTVTGLPTCTDTGVTADIVFNNVAKPNCANGGCHAAGAGGLKFTSGAELRSSMVGVTGGQTSVVPLVTASNVDLSYLMYKLTNQQTTVMGSGVLMPKGKARLADADLCKFIVWIKEGAL